MPKTDEEKLEPLQTACPKDTLIRMTKSERRQQHGMHHAEDRRRRADPERQRADGSRAEAGTSTK